jgi:putative ABC transport system ATP-binding protein
MTRQFEPIIAVHDLVVSFSRWGQSVSALKGLSISVNAGQWVLVAGHNGAGKSTLLKVIAGRIKPDSGQVKVQGHNINGLSSRELSTEIFMVHQDPLLGTAPSLTVFENLFVADQGAVGQSKTQLMNRYSSLVNSVGLADRMNQPAKLLSGGERQLLALVIARLRQARSILLDEPVAALDPKMVGICIEQISEMHRQGSTIVQATHDIARFRSLADRLITVRAGQLVADEMLG